MRRIASAFLLLSLAAPGRAAGTASSFELSVDPNLELLGVVQRLADPSPPPADDAYVRDVDAAFSRFKSHPAVRRYAEILAAARGREGLGIDLLYLTPAPGLELKDPARIPPYMRDGAEGEALARFLGELRDFARKSDFPRFFHAHSALYENVEESARRGLAPVDPPAEIESYLGVKLASRCRYVLSPLYRNEALSAFIEPYPDPRARLGAVSRPFEVYTITPYSISEALESRTTPFEYPAGRLWQEPLYVFIDPSFYFFDKANAPDPEAFYRLSVPGCPAEAARCAKALVVQALVDRLNARAYGAAPAGGTGERARYVAALSARLEEYESSRDRYPTLWSFYPRLFSVFRELKPRAAAEPPLRLPGGPVRATTDFFGPAMR